MKIVWVVALFLLSSLVLARDPFEATIKGVNRVTYIFPESDRPSCQMVGHRLQEYMKRTSEADYLLNWYSPHVDTIEEANELANIFDRMEDYLLQRDMGKIQVVHMWIIPGEFYERLQQHKKEHRFWKVELKSPRINWKDFGGGTLPEEVKFEIEEGRVKIVKLTFDLSFEAFCFKDPEVHFFLGTRDLSLHLTGSHKPQEL